MAEIELTCKDGEQTIVNSLEVSIIDYNTKGMNFQLHDCFLAGERSDIEPASFRYYY